MKLQQPRNYDFGVFQFNLLGSQGGNSREMTTSPPGHHWEATVALTTAAKLQQFRANSRGRACGNAAGFPPPRPPRPSFPDLLKKSLPSESPFSKNPSQQTRVYPYPLGAGSARPNPEMGAPDPENLYFKGFLCSKRE